MDIQAQALSEDDVPNSRSARYSHRGNAASVSRSELHSFVLWFCGRTCGSVYHPGGSHGERRHLKVATMNVGNSALVSDIEMM